MGAENRMEAEEALEILREYQANLVYNMGGKENTPYRVYQRAIESLEREIRNS